MDINGTFRPRNRTKQGRSGYLCPGERVTACRGNVCFNGLKPALKFGSILDKERAECLKRPYNRVNTKGHDSNSRERSILVDKGQGGPVQGIHVGILNRPKGSK